MECPRCHQDNTSDSRFCRYCAAPLVSERGGADDETRRTPEPGLDLLAGDRIAGKYKILRKVGEGGMGVVYEAEDLRLKRRVALKFLSPEQVRAPEAKQRFFREARASSKLDHPNICTIYEIDEDADRRFFIAMAYCPGESIRDKIKRGPLAFPEALEITMQVGRGLASAHEQGIVHRDIKPGNIMETGTGEVKIVDFGLAKLVEDTGITRTAGMTGTLAYMSPEQIQGEHLDFRTDIWSLGVVMYEMFTGLHPFKGETAQELIYSVLNSSPAPPSEVRDALPGRLDGIVLKCLAKDRRHRYQTIRSLVSDLEQLKGSPGEGARPGPAPGKPPAARKESEQRQATVMFVEARGIPEMLETVDPQETPSFLKRFRACFDFIEDSYGGQVDRITDSIVRAVFGYPAAVEDAPAKAVRAALVLQRSLVDWAASENTGTPLKPCFGISSGTVIVGAAGTDEDRRHAVTGDAVAMASQYKDLAKGGAVVVGPEAFRETQEAFAYRPLKPVSLRGRDKPVRLYELLAVKERTARLRLGQERIISSELVGREKERDLLMLHVMKAVNGQGSIVNIIGEAGIGKSALVADLKANPIMAKVGLIEGNALSIGKNLSFHPLIDALRDWAGITEDDGAAESVRKLERSIRGLGPEGPEEIFPFVATLMGLRVTGAPADRLKGIEGEALEKHILKSLRELLERVSQARPLVMILEDLHWADLTSIRFLESLYRLAESNRILFVNVFRPDYEETSQRLLRTIESRYGRIRLDLSLDPLDEAGSEELISNLLKLSTVPPTARELIVERTGGNPFFIEEVLRSFIDDGVVEVRDGAFQITDRINSVVIPKTIQQLLMARIDKLDEDTRSLLKIAAVIGRNFLYRILIDVAGTIPEIDLKLDVLKEGQLIRERRVGDEIELLFKHALVQEAAYESILPKKRKDLHRKIAEAIESIYAGRISDFYGMLALHFGKAEDLEKTEAYLIRAGREALKSSASDEALHYYQEALKIYLAKSGRAADPEKVAMLRKNIGIALFDRGRLFEAIGHFEAAMTLYGAKTPRGMIASFVRFALGFMNFVFSLYCPALRFRKVPSEKEQAVIDLYKRKMTALAVTIPRQMFIESFTFSRLCVDYDLTKVENGLGILAGYSAIFTWPGMSFTLSRKILKVVEPRLRPDDLKPWIYFRFSEVIHYFFKGEWDRISAYDEALVEQSLKIGEFFYTTTYLDILCHSYIERGMIDLAEKCVQRILAIHATYEYDYAKDEYYFLRTLMLVKLRKIRQALRESDEGLAFARQHSYNPDLFSLLAFKTKAQILLDELAGAEETLQELGRVLSKDKEVPLNRGWRLTSQLLLELRRLSLSSGASRRDGRAKKYRQARRLGRKAIRNSRKVASERTEAYRCQGILEWTEGHQGRALKLWTKSLSEGGRLGAQLELAWTYREAGTRLREKASRCREMNHLSADELLAEAESLFRRMNVPAGEV